MPAASPPTARRRRGAKVVLALLSLALATVLGEAVLRVAGGYRLFTLRLQPRQGRPDAVRQLELAKNLVQPFVARWQRDRPDLDPAWLRTSPPPLPRPPALDKPVRPQAQWLLHYYILNEVELRALWVKGKGLPMFPGIVLPEAFTVFAPPGGKMHPRYRYPASRTLPTGLLTNAFGFRGRELPVDKPERTVRIAFVGASTTVEAHAQPYSAPELIEHWLSLWATAKGLDVRFETLNAAREAITSQDMRAIVDDELLPLAVDYVVYYEGANQLQLVTLLKHVHVFDDSGKELARVPLADPPPGLVGTFDGTETADTTWLDRCGEWSAAARYLRSALAGDQRLAEPGKPAQEVVLPAAFADGAMPLEHAGELLELGAIGADLDGIRTSLAAHRARLVLCTFCWLVQDGMKFDPVQGRFIHVHLNRAYWPFSYATVRRCADLENQFFAAWAQQNGVDLLDVAAMLPFDERLYFDAIHHTELGVRLKAWVLFAGLTRLLERDLAAGAIPVPDTVHDERHPNIGPAKIVTRAQLDEGK